MFGPVRGTWPDDSWKGWWGDTPPYHTPVFVLTHRARAPLEMAGGTTFHFITDGPHTALRLAKRAARGRMFASEVACLLFVSISSQARSTRCTWHVAGSVGGRRTSAFLESISIDSDLHVYGRLLEKTTYSRLDSQDLTSSELLFMFVRREA